MRCTLLASRDSDSPRSSRLASRAPDAGTCAANCGFVILGVFLCMLAAACPAAAQEQRATIEGVVRDALGGALAGATVEAANTQVDTRIGTVTDASGAFRFPALAPGDYAVAVQLSGFQTSRVEKVQLRLGQIKTLAFSMRPAGVQEPVEVTGDAPPMDTRQSARATVIRAEEFEQLPQGRDFSSLIFPTPGTNSEHEKLGGLSIDGASAGENRYLVDGAETTNLQTGTQGKTVLPDFVEEIQVKSSGFTAEHGGAPGGVVNVVTKSGTNRWLGSAILYYEAGALAADRLEGTANPRSLRLGLADANVAEEVTHPGDDFSRVEPGVTMGGPVLRDRAWLFVGYSPAFVGIERTATLTADGSTVTTEQARRRHSLTASNTAQFGSGLRTRVAFNNSWSQVDGSLVSSAGTDAPGTDYATGNTYPNWSLSGQADWVASPSVHLGSRVGYYCSDKSSFGVPEASLYRFVTSNIGMPGVPSGLQQATNFRTVPTNSATAFDKQERFAFQVDGTWSGTFGGRHTLKGGLQVDQLGNEVLSGEQGNVLDLYWGRSYAGASGPYGYYRVRSNGFAPQRGFITEGDVSATSYGFFVQDAWTVGDRLTLNLGLRTENEKVPVYSREPGVPTYGIEFGFADKLAPRVGFAYDIQGDGSWKAYGSWGRVYDVFKVELPRSAFGGDKWVDYWFTLDTPSWNTLDASPNCPPACPGALIDGPVDFRRPSFGPDGIDPGLRPMQTQELSFGLDRQVSPVLAVSARYVHKRLVRAVEDTGSLDAAGSEIFVIANPGESLAELAWHDPATSQPRAKRDYDSIELALTKALSDNYFLRASYLWSRLYGNYSGLSQSDENGRTSPNVGRTFDYPLMSFDENAEAVFGPLATDRPHQFKLSYFYQTSFGMSFGLNAYTATGIPRTRQMPVVPGHEYPMLYLGRNSDGRLPFQSQTDLLVQQEFRLAGSRRLQVSLNVENLYNEANVIDYFATEAAAGASVDLSERLFYLKQTPPIQTLKAQQNVPTDPRFLRDSRWQAPIAARLGVKLIF